MTFHLKTLALYGGPRTIQAGIVGTWPPIGRDDEEMVLSSLRSKQHKTGAICERFESEFAKWNGNTYCIATNSGTAALHMGLAACGVAPGDHVIVPAYTWPSAAACVLHQRAVPIFVDIDFRTMNVDTAQIEAAVTPRTKAIIAVHLHGLAAEMPDILSMAVKNKLIVVEDACQAYGTLYNGVKVGNIGHCAAFSLNQHKTLSAGEGGLFVTNDYAKFRLAQHISSFCDSEQSPGEWDYHAEAGAWMYRMNDLTASLARSQLRRLDYYLIVQRSNALLLLEYLKPLSYRGLILPCEPTLHQHSWHELVCRLDMGTIGWEGDPATFRDRVVAALCAEGVEAHVWQRYLLPQMAPFAQERATDSVASQYPQAMRHVQTHFGINTMLRPPNNKSLVEQIAEALFKVFDNISDLCSPRHDLYCRQ